MDWIHEKADKMLITARWNKILHKKQTETDLR